MLVGSGPLEDEIKKKVEKLDLKDSVLFLGQRDDINKLYSVMDIFCLPSLYEGLPVVGVEAQAAGLPCVFSNKITKNIVLCDNTQMLSIKNNRNQWLRYMESAKIDNKKRTDIKINKEFNIDYACNSLYKI